MTAEGILRHVDYTCLKASASWEEIKRLCEESIQYHTASVCIPPIYVRLVSEYYGKSLVIGTVVGFPLGYHSTAVKVIEMDQVLRDGAQEIDMVINQCDVKNAQFESVAEEIAALKQNIGSGILKVIVETCSLTQAEKIQLCTIVKEAGAHYIKTSTGFGSAGATLEDIALFKEHCGPHLKIKAAGGIKTREALEAFLHAGCDRIGSSSAVALLAPEIIHKTRS
ncbi:MAG: deoxyribose-phosphate aldolase [Treponema sp.]|jgi:deoxyribose-phosphate aldolase|nr:deoxyribose-phosphate aldolase [Treponema sp.]